VGRKVHLVDFNNVNMHLEGNTGKIIPSFIHNHNYFSWVTKTHYVVSHIQVH